MALVQPVPASNPAETNEQGHPLPHPAAQALAAVPETESAGPLGDLGGQLHSVLGTALPSSSSQATSGGPSPHLSPEQFGPALGDAAGAGEMGAAAPASGAAAGGLADLAPLAAL